MPRSKLSAAIHPELADSIGMFPTLTKSERFERRVRRARILDQVILHRRPKRLDLILTSVARTERADNRYPYENDLILFIMISRSRNSSHTVRRELERQGWKVPLMLTGTRKPRQLFEHPLNEFKSVFVVSE